MERPRIRHIALNVKDRGKVAEYYKRVFGMEEKFRSEKGTVFLSDGFVDVALISTTRYPYGINHFGFQVQSLKAIEELIEGKATPNPPEPGIIADCWIPDEEGNRVDISEGGWPI